MPKLTEREKLVRDINGPKESIRLAWMDMVSKSMTTVERQELRKNLKHPRPRSGSMGIVSAVARKSISVTTASRVHWIEILAQQYFVTLPLRIFFKLPSFTLTIVRPVPR